MMGVYICLVSNILPRYMPKLVGYNILNGVFGDRISNTFRCRYCPVIKYTLRHVYYISAVVGFEPLRNKTIHSVLRL